MSNRITARDIEVVLADHFGYRQALVVPNVSWGWHMRHEADMVVLYRSGWATEVEIKVSLGDVKADRIKRYNHWECDKICKVWFAMPETLALRCSDVVPREYGILAVRIPDDDLPKVVTIRGPHKNPKARRCTSEERLKLAELGSMRIWDVKKSARQWQQNCVTQNESKTAGMMEEA